MSADGLKRLFDPKTVAVFGGGPAAQAISQCRGMGFTGEIWAVNPKRRDVGGLRCFRTAGELPSAPDASFIAAPPETTVKIIGELAARGAGGAVCYAAGFAELGEAGAILQQQLRIAAAGMAVIGPNCHGFLNYLDGVALWPDQHGGQRVERGVALVSQSGNLGINLSMQQRGLDFAYIVSIGNKTCLGLHDYIDFLIRDARVTAIGLHIESIEQIHLFCAASIRALQAGIPIVAIKTGHSSRGAELNRSHTASLAGPDRLYAALFRRLGIARCQTVAQLVETLKFVSTTGVLTDSTLGSMSCSGGEASLIADCADTVKLALPALSRDSSQRIREILGPKVSVSNPLDYHTYAWGDHEKLKACFSAMLSNAFACSILVLDYPRKESSDIQNWLVAENALIDAIAQTGQKAVIVATLPETMPAEVRLRLKAAGITAMQGLEDCLFAIRMAAVIGQAQRDVARIVPVHEPRAIDGESAVLDEWRSKAALKGFGLRVPDGELCKAGDTKRAADRLGYPVVLKAVSSQLIHKSDAGAVFVNLTDDSGVESATARLSDRFEHFIVEKMVGPAVAEVIVGIHRDPTFGLTLMLGSGGILVELVDDTVSLLMPVQRHEIVEAIMSLKAWKLLNAFRGAPPGDIEALVDAVTAIADYAEAHRAGLLDCEINPLLVLEQGAVAVDAFIRKTITAG